MIIPFLGYNVKHNRTKTIVASCDKNRVTSTLERGKIAVATEVKIIDNQMQVTISGDVRRAYPASADMALRRLGDGTIKSVVVSGAKITDWDSALIVWLMRMMRTAGDKKIKIKFISMPQGVMDLIGLARTATCVMPQAAPQLTWVEQVGDWGIRMCRAVGMGMRFIGMVGASLGRMFRGRAQTRPVDWWFAFEDVGPRAILIVSLISFLIGLILAFVGAAQLKLFGAQVYVASLVAIAAIRIMGAMMTGIIMAGRTGASYAATIGTMQANEELDALRTMGIRQTDFLVLPRVIAMVVSMPILTLLADAMAILGGMFVGVLMFRIPGPEYVAYTMDALGIQNFMVGIFHGFVYGLIIALCGCYYGIHSGRNADSVGVATTRAVVMSIVWMVVATGFITFLFEVLGI